MSTERERSYSVTRIRAALRGYLAPRMVDQILADLGEEKHRAPRRQTPTADDHAIAARLLKRKGIKGT